MISVLFILTAVFYSCKGQDFNSMCPSLSGDITKCSRDFLSGLINVDDIFSDISQVINVQNLMSKQLSAFCKDPTAIKKYYGCVFEKLITCLPEEWRKVLPTADSIEQSIGYLCENADDVDVTCMLSQPRTNNFARCLLDSTGTVTIKTASDYMSYMCSFFPKYSACLKTAYSSCPKRTADVYVKMNELQKPAGCDACVSRSSLFFLISALLLSRAKIALM